MKKISRSKAKSRVFLLEGSDLARRSLARLLAFEPDMEVCGEAATVEQAVQRMARSRPDVAVVNVDPLNGGGPAVLTRLRWQFPTLPLIVLSLHREDVNGRRMLQAGAAGYLNQADAARHVVPALRRVLKGGLYPGRGKAGAARKR